MMVVLVVRRDGSDRGSVVVLVCSNSNSNSVVAIRVRWWCKCSGG